MDEIEAKITFQERLVEQLNAALLEQARHLERIDRDLQVLRRRMITGDPAEEEPAD